MQHVVFVPAGVLVPDECIVETNAATVNGRIGQIVRPRHGWRLVPGVCCDEWAFTRDRDWVCPACETRHTQHAPGLWTAIHADD